jgi:WD40 repeat protein
MIKPLLTPVFDIDYYMPEFKTFKKQKLFNKNNYVYNINLDVDEILKYEVNLKNKNKELFNSLKNSYGFNYLECLYKIVDEEIWDNYQLSQEEKLNPNKIIFRKNTTILSKPKIKEKKDEIKNHTFSCCMVKVTNHIKGNINTKDNCLEFIYDEVDDNDEDMNNQILYVNIEDDISYDKDMKCCYGSMFGKHKRDREKINFIINYEDIKYIFIRNYYYRDTAVEIYTEMNKSYFFNFKNNNELLLLISDITKNELKIKFRPISSNIHDEKEKTKKIGYEKVLPSMKNKVYFISNKTEEWHNYNISTFEYLMWLNIYSGRSFNDLNQYPVFPWIFTNYSNNEITNNDYRNLDLPIGMLENGDSSIKRKTTFITFYETLKENFRENYPDIDYQSFLNKGKEYLDSYKKKRQKLMKKEKNQIQNNDDFYIPYTDIPYNYGTHYSNPTYVSHYLSRIFPFSFVSIEIHGDKFDDIDRMFFSMEKTFESISTLKDDIREIIPEFYYFPEIFKNNNNLDLAQGGVDSNGNKIEINNVTLPLWSQNNAENFVIKMREGLESEKCLINKWIDIIFGSYQRGENAEKINNIFMSYTYEKMMNILEINDYEQRSALLRLYETGVTPRLLFKNDLKARIEKSAFIQKNPNANIGFLEDVALLEKKYQNMPKYQLLCDNININNKKNPKIIKIIKILIKSNDRLELITNTNHYFDIKIQKEEKNELKIPSIPSILKDQKKDQKIFYFENTSTMYVASCQLSSIVVPIIIYNNNKIILKGGFWDGRIEINSLPSDSKEETISSMVFSGYDHPIVCMKMTKDEKLLICGTKVGSVIVYNVNGYNLEINDIIYSHSDEITSISIDDNLNMFATASIDGYINLYILPSLQLVRVIHISSLKQKIDNNNININKNQFEEEIFQEYKEEKCLYADNVFLSSSPLACIAIFISNKRVFRSYSINGELIKEVEEKEVSKINSPIVFKNMNFFDYLIYGTNKGYIQIRSFPKMELINSIVVNDTCNITTLSLSNDKKFCYTWEGSDNLSIIYNNISNILI